MISSTQNNDIILTLYTIYDSNMNVSTGDIIQEPLKAARRSWLLPSSNKNSKQWQHKPRPPNTTRDYMLNPPNISLEIYISFIYNIDKYSNLWNNRRYSIIVETNDVDVATHLEGFPWKSSPFLHLPQRCVSNVRMYVCIVDKTSDNWFMLKYKRYFWSARWSEQ